MSRDEGKRMIRYLAIVSVFSFAFSMGPASAAQLLDATGKVNVSTGDGFANGGFTTT